MSFCRKDAVACLYGWYLLRPNLQCNFIGRLVCSDSWKRHSEHWAVGWSSSDNSSGWNHSCFECYQLGGRSSWGFAFVGGQSNGCRPSEGLTETDRECERLWTQWPMGASGTKACDFNSRHLRPQSGQPYAATRLYRTSWRFCMFLEWQSWPTSSIGQSVSTKFLHSSVGSIP